MLSEQDARLTKENPDIQMELHKISCKQEKDRSSKIEPIQRENKAI